MKQSNGWRRCWSSITTPPSHEATDVQRPTASRNLSGAERSLRDHGDGTRGHSAISTPASHPSARSSWTELTDATQALKWRCVHEFHHHGLARSVLLQTDFSMQWVVVRPLPHGMEVLLSSSSNDAIHCSASFSQRSPSPPGLRGSGSESRRSGSIPAS